MHTRKLDGYISRFASVLPPRILILTSFVLVCLSADWAGALVLFNSFLFVFEFSSGLLSDDRPFGLLFSWVFLFCCFLWVVCWGLQCTACSLRPTLVVFLWPAFRGPFLFVWFLFLVSRFFFWPCVFCCCFPLVALLPLELHAPLSLARAAFSLLSLLYGNIHSRAYSGHVLRFLCNWHGGYALMFLTIRLDRTLEMMQNDAETSKFESEAWRFCYFWMMMFDIL